MSGRSIVLRKKRSPLENRPSGNTGKYELRSEPLESRLRWYSAGSDATYGTLKQVQESSRNTRVRSIEKVAHKMPFIWIAYILGPETDPMGQGPSAQTAVNIALSLAYRNFASRRC